MRIAGLISQSKRRFYGTQAFSLQTFTDPELKALLPPFSR